MPGMEHTATQQAAKSLQEIIDKSRRIVFFGGAGVSTESGIPDFRSSGGLYRQEYRYPPEEVVSHAFFLRHTEEFYQFYKSRILYPDARPNPAHFKLAELEQAGRLTAVITQNIDGLHQAAGSRNVLELHGSVHRNYCMECHRFYDAAYIRQSKGIPRCACGGIIKPDVVLYGESLDGPTMERAAREIRQADTLIVGGTSLAVYPAAGFLDFFGGRYLVVINRDATPRDADANLLIRQPIGEVMSRLTVQEDSPGGQRDA